MLKHFTNGNGEIERQEFLEPDIDLQFENAFEPEGLDRYVAKVYDNVMFRAIEWLYGGE